MDTIEEQLLAYNARDLERFIATYAPEVVIEDGEDNVLMKGHAQMRGREERGRMPCAPPRVRLRNGPRAHAVTHPRDPTPDTPVVVLLYGGV